MPKTNPDKPLCQQCNKRNAQAHMGGICRPCFDANKSLETIPQQLQEARSGKDWVKLAETLAETYAGIADGSVKATAAQASILRTIWERAYGKPTKTQDDLTGASGVVILPVVGGAALSLICPRCQSEYDLKQLARWKAFLTTEGKSIDGRINDGGETDRTDSNSRTAESGTGDNRAEVDERSVGGIDDTVSTPSSIISSTVDLGNADSGAISEDQPNNQRSERGNSPSNSE